MNIPESHYLTTREAALYLRFEYPDGTPNVNAFYVARHRHRIRGYRRGWKLLFKRADLDAYLQDEHAGQRAFEQYQAEKVALIHERKVRRRSA